MASVACVVMCVTIEPLSNSIERSYEVNLGRSTAKNKRHNKHNLEQCNKHIFENNVSFFFLHQWYRLRNSSCTLVEVAMKVIILIAISYFHADENLNFAQLIEKLKCDIRES